MILVPLALAADRARFGGKAAHLARDLVAGLPVPDGYAVDAAGTEAVAEGRARIGGWLPDALWAVRSSALDEDGARASFAGQHESVVGVRRGQVDAAVARVFASGRTEAAQAYRRRVGASPEARMAVVVQRVVSPRAAAVVFTKDPVGGAAEIVVEASFGFGEAVVAGLVVPDRFRMTYEGAILERTAGEKDVEIVVDEDQVVRRPIEGDRVRALCLDDDDLLAIARLVRAVRAIREGEHDLEMAFDSGGLHLLQRRDITR